MAITLLDQETQIRNTAPVALYDDTVAPSEANFETNAATLLDDLNNLRSQVSNLLDGQVNDWFTDLLTPSALDTGTQRGVNDLNTDLHALERKRVLVKAVSLADIAVAAAVAATGVLTLTGNVSDGDQVETGGKTYTFQATLTNVDGNVLIGATASDSIDNLIAAINLGAGAGTDYAAATTANPVISAAAGAGDTMDATALKAGTFGNSVSTTDPTDGGGVMSWGGATLSGGSGGDVVILGSGELPPNTTAAVGAVTTLGTIVAAPVTTLGTAELLEVAGTTPISPKNFAEVVDASTRDPILSDGRTIYGLVQGETGLADGDTILDAGSDRVQITFVRINSTGDDLETIDGADLGGQSVNLCFTERKALEGLTEQDFLRGAVTDVPAASVVTRQAAYDNQGITPVDVTTNSTLDLEGAGLTWEIRDDLQATLFKITEGSAGGTSEVAIEADTDTFRSDAVTNDFDNGASFDTGAAGTTINVGVTANQIDSGGALRVESGAGSDLTLDGTNQLIVTDGNQAGSGFATALVLSDTSQEWDDFETKYGEVSLLRAICLAQATVTRRTVHSVATVAAAADANVSGPSNDNNLDTDLGDLSGLDFGLTSSMIDVYLNGAIQVQDSSTTGANDKDVYPGTSLANGQLKFEKKIKVGDVICIVDWSEAP